VCFTVIGKNQKGREGESEREMDRTRKKEKEMRKGIERETEQ